MEEYFGTSSSSEEEERNEIKRSERKQINSIQSSSESENESNNSINNDSDRNSDEMPRKHYRKLKKSSSFNDDRSLNFDSDNEKENARDDLSDINDNDKEDIEMGDLFGEEDEEKSSDEENSDENRNNIISRERSRTRSRSASRSLSPAVEKKIISIDVSVANLEPPSKDNSNIYLAKLPNTLDIEPEPFDPLTYKGVEEEEARLRENVIRWRYKKDKNNNYLPDQKESNARFIKWSDGSLSLLLGDEMYEVNLQEIDSHQYVVVLHSKEGVLQTQAQLTTSMSFQPYGLKSLTHKKLTASIAEKHQRSVKTKMFTGEHNKNDLRQEIKDNRRINQRLERLQQRKNKSKNTENTRAHHNKNKESEDEDDSYSRKSSRYNRYEEEEDIDSDNFVVNDDEYDEEEEEERQRAKEERILKAKREGEKQRRRLEKQKELSRKRKFEEPEEEISNEEEEEETDDNDEDENVTIKKKTKKRQVLMSDDEE
jgi:RNA polymerase-associated protein LEO1